MSKRKNIVEGAFGLRMPETSARYLDDLLKTLPQEQRTLKRKTGLVSSSEFMPGEKADVSWITTDDIDREGEVILPDGLDLVQYQSNPVVLWNHEGSAPIGKAQWIKRAGNGIKAKTVYATRPETHVGEWLPDTIFALVQQEVLKGRSIGFIPVEMVAPSLEHTKARPEWAKANCLITKSVLFEYSVVSVPCNGAALQEAVSKGVKLELMRRLGLTTAKPAKRALTRAATPKVEPLANLEKALRNMNLDLQKIADQVYYNLVTRGRV